MGGIITFCPKGVAYLDEQPNYKSEFSIEDEYERVDVETINIQEIVAKVKDMNHGSYFIILQKEFPIIVSMYGYVYNEGEEEEETIKVNIGDTFEVSYEELDVVNIK
ncbi:hypothetical protein FB645_002320 [Coemansia sp. IMI 203386]|nr:hypothetical protein FB645_002320 [Coemansia sp. IMI 203386]